MALSFLDLPVRLSFIGLLLLLAGCAATVAPPALPPAALDWSAEAALPDTVRTALQGSRLETVSAGEGLEVPFRLYGSSGRRTPVLMVHGLQSHSGWFSQSAAFISGLGHPVYVLDRRGSGMSRAVRGDSKDFMDWSEDIQAVADYAGAEHGHQQVIVLGHCFGAIPATVYAEVHPEMLRGLILATPGVYTHTSIPFSQTLKILFSSAGQMDFYFAVPLDPGQFSELPEYEPFIADDPLALRAVTGDLYWQIHRARKYIKRNSAQLTMPILVGMAGEDEIADNRKNLKWLAAVPSADKTIVVYDDARHILEYSLERDKYFQDLKDWLARIEEL